MSQMTRMCSEPSIRIFYRDHWWRWIVEFDTRTLGGQARELEVALQDILISCDRIKEVNPNPRREP